MNTIKQITIFVIIAFISTIVQSQTIVFDNLLQKYVDAKGNVDYENFKKDETQLAVYISYLQKTTPQKDWSKNKTKAFWMNVYNAYTLKTILENYPVSSITEIKKDGKDAWNIASVNVGGKIYTLNAVEHEILRKDFNDPRIHVGINCASWSCPKLHNKAFTETNVDDELEKLMKGFINDTNRNKISEKKIQISKIFEWFKGDFTKQGTLIDYFNKYSEIKINKKAKVKFLDYNWSLNKKE